MPHKVLSLIFWLFALSANGMDIDFATPTEGQLPTVIRLSGEIQKGDHKSLLRILTPGAPTAAFAYTSIYELDSLGGDVEEAMLMADILKDTYSSVRVNGTCASSCILLYLAGAIRVVREQGRLGVHRPYFEKGKFASLSVHEAQQRYQDLEQRFKSYLASQGLPHSIIETLMATPSNDIHWLTEQELGTIGWMPPHFHELMLARCGEYLEQNSPGKPFSDKDSAVKCIMVLRLELAKSKLDILKQRLIKEKMPTRYCPIDGTFRPC